MTIWETMWKSKLDNNNGQQRTIQQLNKWQKAEKRDIKLQQASSQSIGLWDWIGQHHFPPSRLFWAPAGHTV
jgi:hypothetical protein